MWRLWLQQLEQMVGITTSPCYMVVYGLTHEVQALILTGSIQGMSDEHEFSNAALSPLPHSTNVDTHSGNGEDYKQVPNSEKEWEITAYPELVAAIRSAVGPDKILSAAVPGLERDMLAFTELTVPKIMSQLDFLNVMTYDMMNRRDTVTKHHTGTALSLNSIEAYLGRGARPDQLNVGLAFYAKWFETQECEAGHEVGCKTVLMEDPETGADLGGSGGFSWHDPIPDDVASSFQRALSDGKFDAVGGGYYYWDESERRWWTFDTPSAIQAKARTILEARGLGGIFAWGLGEDAPHWNHLAALNEGLKELRNVWGESWTSDLGVFAQFNGP